MDGKIENINTSQKAARIAGLLFLVQMVAAVISHSVILDPILFGNNFPAGLAANSTRVIVAMLLDLLTGASVFGIAVILFPILKKHSERIALWYLGLRLNEWVVAISSGVFLMAILSISRDYVQAGAPEASSLLALGKHLLKARGAAQNLGLLGFCLSATMFYYLLFKSRLIPRFISIWGLIGVVLLFAEILANIFGRSLGGIKIMLPMGLNEIFLGIWLMVKGFNLSAELAPIEQ